MDAPKINDDEGVDFGFYFSTKYQMSQSGKRPKYEGKTYPERVGRGRGRGRGERGGHEET